MITERSLAAEHSFRERLADLGATLLEPAWLGCGKPHRVRCVAGHECHPYPTYVQQGGGICKTCAGLNPAVVEQTFRSRLAALGATLLEAAWLGTHRPHRVRCREGHECHPRPGNLQAGQGLCRTCAGQDRQVARANFLSQVIAQGGVILESTWLGNNRPHRVRCKVGHLCRPRPTSVQRGFGICSACARTDTQTAFSDFQSAVVRQGGRVLEPSWLGSRTPHRVRCPAGHDCTPAPNSIQQGHGICRFCAAGFNRDEPALVYLVTHPLLGAHKIGVASSQNRVRCWQGRGWSLYRTLALTSGAAAVQVEQAVFVWLRQTLSLSPFLGPQDGDGWTETFDASAIDMATAWSRVEQEAFGLSASALAGSDTLARVTRSGRLRGGGLELAKKNKKRSSEQSCA